MKRLVGVAVTALLSVSVCFTAFGAVSTCFPLGSASYGTGIFFAIDYSTFASAGTGYHDKRRIQ